MVQDKEEARVDGAARVSDRDGVAASVSYDSVASSGRNSGVLIPT